MQPADPTSPQLSEENLRQIAAARLAYRKIGRAIKVARADGWTIAFFGGITLLFGLTDFTSILVGGALCTVAYFELNGAGKLRRLDPSAIKILFVNQLVLASLLILYSLWSLYADLHGGDLAAVASQDAQVAQFVGIAAQILYSVLILVAIFGCGGMALYYRTRRSHLQDYLEKTPPWILAMQTAGITI